MLISSLYQNSTAGHDSEKLLTAESATVLGSLCLSFNLESATNNSLRAERSVECALYRTTSEKYAASVDVQSQV